MTSTIAQRYVLVPAPRAERDDAVQRYKLARLRLDTLHKDTSGRFGHLKRTYD